MDQNSKEPPALKPHDLYDLNLPVFDAPQKEHWPKLMPWEIVMRHFHASRVQYMKDHYSAEARLRDKNPEPFRL